MAVTHPAPQPGLTLALPRQAECPTSAISTQPGARALAWAGACQGAWIAGHAGAAIAGGLTTGGWHTLGYVPDALIGALITLALFSGLTALLRLVVWLAASAAGRLGTLAARQVGPRALAPARCLRALPGRAIAALLVTGLMVFEHVVPFAPFQMLRLAYPGELLWLVLMPAGMLAGAAMSGNAGFGRFLPPGRVAQGMLAVAVALPIALGGWFLYPGTDSYLPLAAASLVGQRAFDFANPALAGSYAVETLTYGGGNDRHRPEYGADVTLHTESVDGSQVFMGFTGFEGAFFRWYWGFGMNSLPLQGRVWLPVGEGPFPLVLIVHGNHMAGDFSDPGFAYLGEHLAGRGFITVSADENFLNGFNLYDAKGQEMAARAWLLLEHLDQFKTWNSIAGNPFYGRVDLSRVALIGHSRGGEAVAHAAALNRRIVSPVSNVAGPGDYGYGIQGVIAIAPCDGQWAPQGVLERLKDVSYLLLQGGHDADMTAMRGIRQYNRVDFESNPAAFKAVAYINRANHGQFNTVWGRHDKGSAVYTPILNLKPLLSGEEQRTAAKVFVTSFLEATLHGRAEYHQVFQRPAGARVWLPEDVYVTQYRDASFKAVATFERAGEVEQIDMPEGGASLTGFSFTGRADLPLRDGESQGNKALLVRWERGATPEYTINLAGGEAAGLSLQGNGSLTFTLARADAAASALGMTVELVDAAGNVASVPFSRFGALPPPLQARLVKSEPVAALVKQGYDLESRFERAGQVYAIPLAAFRDVAPEFDPARLLEVRFKFDGAEGGSVYLDDVGFRDQ